MVKCNKHGHVLQDHFKKGNTYYPRFTYSGHGLSRFEQIKWRADFVPELIWIALLVQDYDFDEAKKIACDIAFFSDQSQIFSKKHDFGQISSYSYLSNESKAWVLKKLSTHSDMKKIQKSLSPLVRLYPDCPLSFLCQTLRQKPGKNSAYAIVGKALEEMLYRGEKLPTLAQGIHYDVQISTEKLIISSDLRQVSTETLKKYPDDEEAKMVASIIRVSTVMMKIDCQSNDWAKYFWNRERDLGPCAISPQNDLFIGSIPQEIILYHLECFRKYFERANDIWLSIEKHYKIDFYAPLKDEILLGLACRIYRLTIHVVSFIPNWTEDISEVYIRMVLESYIYYKWLKQNGKENDYQKFYEPGLGQQKLKMEHVKQYLKSQGLSEEELEKETVSLDFLKKHKMPEFVPVNVGNPLDKNLRIIADEAECREIYAMMYSPASSAVHGMYDSLDLFYSRTCTNPFHCLHKVPYHWSKCPISTYGPFNCLGITDWVLSDILMLIDQEVPKKLPGELFIKEILNKKDLDAFSKKKVLKSR